MAMTRARRTLIALLGVALAGLFAVGAWASIDASISRSGPTRVVGPEMMGRASSGGMMNGYGLAGDGQPVTSLAAARQRAQLLADRLGLRTGEVIQFSNGFYVKLVDADGQGAVEVLVDPAGGGVGLEYGPGMMWNTRYGAHAAGTDAAVRVSAADARRGAQRWLDDQRPGLTAGEPELFPGYYTLQTMRDSMVTGMMSVNAFTGAVWYHTWHGSLVALTGE
jgi:hypothetical protein